MSKPSGENAQLQASQANLANVMAQTGQQSAQEGSTLFNLALPGLEQSEAYYGKLASGDPAALARANAPAIQQITAQTTGAKKNIVADMPRGGERNLALEEADINAGSEISKLTTGSYISSFGSLAGLGGQNVSQGTAATGVGLQGMNAAANQYGQIQQINAEQKASQLGFFSSLAGAGAEAAGAFCWVAIAIWGEDALQTIAVRKFFYDVLQNHWIGRRFFKAYERFGERWAVFIQSSAFWYSVTEFVFEILFVQALDHLPEKSKTEVYDIYFEMMRKDQTGAR